jgi:demethylmenaquinone methyltransferase/2-methoxy-6-polyprenyl-1,4-benzoquinol methylase
MEFQMKWYDLITPLYDAAIRSLYAPYRRILVQRLDLRPGDTVLDLGCGSGLNFSLVMALIGPQGTLIGIDYSRRMLARAQKIADKNNWKNVHLFEQDVRNLNTATFATFMGANVSVDTVICTLGMSVFPDWRLVFDETFTLLKKGGKYGVMDLFNSDLTFSTKLVNFLASSEISRPVWEPLQAKCVDFHEEKHRVMRHGNDVVVIAAGKKE